MQTFKKLHRQFQQYQQKQNFPPQPKGLYDPIRYIMNLKGKQLRPLMLLMAYLLYEEEPSPALPVAYAIELFHSFTLLHDDIMDEAALRRGSPTVHHIYGTNTAILSGDVMMIYVYKYISQAVPKKLLPHILEVFNEVAIGVCEGQQMDMDFENRIDVSLAEYLQMIELKTAVLIAGTLKMGALLGGASDKDATHLYHFGKNIGIAFQIQDDYLDTFGDQKTFGKKIGGDIIQNKKTYLYLKARQVADKAQNDLLDHYYHSKDQEEEEKIKMVTSLFKELKVQKSATLLQETLQQNAFAHLDEVQCSPQKKEPLRTLAYSLLTRHT